MQNGRLPISLLQLTLLLATINRCTAATDYERDIKPLLQARCFACHGALKQESGLRLDTAAMIRNGGSSGAAIDVQHPNASLLLDRVLSTDAEYRMPPEGEPLTDVQVEHLRSWIAAGGTGPVNELPEQDPDQHWAFQTVVRPALPTSAFPNGNQNPIDAFVAQRLNQQQWQPQPPADRAVLLRRVYLDLIGLPPTREQLQAFIQDESPESFEHVVDQLLLSPQYGERWGRHWMDVWRYSDWYGRRMVPDVWNSAPQIWRWRDWIVQSLNADKGYDRMLAEMLAADEIDPENDEACYATGFLIRNWYALNPNDWMRSNVEHTGKAFLGLTFNCAHCHDHKYDPITQEDYFRFRAYFEPIGIRQDRVAGEPDPGPFQEYSYSVLRKIVRIGAVRIFDKSPELPTWFYTGGDERNRDTDRGSIAPGTPAFLTPIPAEIQPVALPARAWYPGLRPAVHETILSERQQALQKAEQQLAIALLPVAGGEDSRRPDEGVSTASVVAADTPSPAASPATNLHGLQVHSLQQQCNAIRADLTSIHARIAADRAQYGESDSAEAPTLAAEAVNAERTAATCHAQARVAECEHLLAVAEMKPADDANREKEVQAAAKALADARTAVAAAEARLAETSQSAPGVTAEYTAFSSKYPTTSTGRRSSLVNWMISRRNPLTARVAVNHIWMRHFHQPLVETVSDFGRSAQPPSHPELLDWLAAELMDSGWSMKHLHRLIVTSNTYRMSSNAGLVDDPRAAKDPENRLLWRMNSGRMEAEVVRDSLLFTAGQLDLQMGGQELENNQALTTYRRSLYYSCNPELDGKSQFGALFDAAEASECYRRTRSVIPQQALALTNSELIHQLSRTIVEKWEAGTETDASGEKLIQEMFEQILSRAPSSAELQECSQFLSAAASEVTDADSLRRSRESLVRALLNHNDFVAIR